MAVRALWVALTTVDVERTAVARLPAAERRARPVAGALQALWDTNRLQWSCSNADDERREEKNN